MFILHLPNDIASCHDYVLKNICGSLVGVDGGVDPRDVVADLGIDTRFVPLGTAVTPGHNTLQPVAAHHWATRVTLQATRVS